MSKELSLMLRKFAPLSLGALIFAAGCTDGSAGTTGPSVRPVMDQVGNNLDASLDAVAEVMPLTVGGPNGTTTLYINPTDGDGKPGCNLTGSTALGLSIVSSDAAVATVSPSSVIFTSCGDTKALTITQVAPGSATISVSQTSNTTGRTFELGEAAFTVNVSSASPLNTAPTISIVGVTGGASYNKGSVPAAMCSVTDAEDGNSTFAATLSAITGPYAVDGIGSQEASCSYTDAGGELVSSSLTYSIVDPSPPTIGSTLSPAAPDGSNGWYKSNVSLTWTVTENESPSSLAKTGCVDQNITADQAETTYSCSATSAGSSAGPVDVKIKRDATVPSVSFIGGPLNGNTYFEKRVPAEPSCNATDATPGSGLDGACSVSGYSNAVGTHTMKVTAKDNAGNVTEVTRTYTVRPSWTLKGFYSPVDMGGLTNTVKGGATVPLKFEVFDGATELTSTGADVIESFRVTTISCTAAPTDDIENYSTGGTSLRYDTTAGQFIQNWQTPKFAGLCIRVTMTTIDGSELSAVFRTK
jgi:hypothetical protein